MPGGAIRPRRQNHRKSTKLEKSTGPGTVDELIQAYKASRFYRALRPATRRNYDWALEILSKWAGDEQARAITPVMAQELYEPMQAVTPAKANAVMRVARLLWSAGRRIGKVSTNPFEQPGLIGLPRSGKLWPREAVALIVQCADELGLPSIGTAVMLNEWLGQREADVLRLPRAIYRNGAIKLRQSKTGAGVELPIDMVQPLAARLEAEYARQRSKNIIATTAIVSELTGKPWNEHTFRHKLNDVRELAARISPTFECDYIVAGRDPHAPDAYTVRMDELQFMHLRHTAVVRLAEAGCEIPLIAAITGHKLKTIEWILEHYLIRTGEMARQAFAKRLAHERKQRPA